MFEQIADAFHIPGHRLGLARRPWEPEESRPHAAPHTSYASPENDDDLATMGAFRHADRATGGGRLYSAVITHLRERVAPRLVDLNSDHAFAAAAVLTEMAGWMAHDSGHDKVAEAHFARAMPLAHASGDTALIANIAASSSHLALQCGDPAAAAHWARTGLDAGRKGMRVPTLIARLHTMQARALAAAGQHTAAESALDQARAALRDAPARVTHPWVSPFDSAALASETADALRDLGRLQQAVEYAQLAVDQREAGRARSLALSRISLASLQLQCGNLDAALFVAEELLAATAPTLGSVRVMRRLDSLSAQLEEHQSHRPARELLIRLTAERKTRMLLLADILTSQGGQPV